MYLHGFKKTYLRAFLIAPIIAFICISIFGVFGSTEMQAKQHDRNISFTNVESSGPADHLEDLAAWENMGYIFTQSILSIVLAIFSLLLLSFFSFGYSPFLKDLYAENTQGIAYRSPPRLFSRLQEAFSRGLLNSKVF